MRAGLPWRKMFLYGNSTRQHQLLCWCRVKVGRGGRIYEAATAIQVGLLALPSVSIPPVRWQCGEERKVGDSDRLFEFDLTD